MTNQSPEGLADEARQALSEYREAPFRSAEWLAGRMMDIFGSNSTKGDGSWSTTAASTSDAHKELAELLKKVGSADLTSVKFRIVKNELADFVIRNSASILAALVSDPLEAPLAPDFLMVTDKGDVEHTIPMILFCPNGHRHIDEQDFAHVAHHTHACQECGIVWRPAKVNTHGVRFLPGYKNED